MTALMIIAGLAGTIFYLWGAYGAFTLNGRERLQLLTIVALWCLLAGVGSLIFLLTSFDGVPSLLGIIGGAFALATPFLWTLGGVSGRLRSHGVPMGRIFGGK